MSSYEDVELNYQSIKESFEVLRRYLIKQLNKCFVTGIDNYNFTELIEAVGEIQSVEYYNSNNIKPTQKPAIDTTNLTTYNETLFFRVRYYMRLLAYFLCLKGVPTDKIAAQHDLAGLISLIDLIDVKLPTTMTVQDITEDYYFGLNIALDYTLKDIYGNDVTDGEILIEADDIIYDSIEAGRPISFTPLRISEKVNGVYEPITFKFTYMGSDKYMSYPEITRDIIVKPAKIKVDVFMYNTGINSQYYNSTTTGYTDDIWSITVKTYNYKGEVLTNIPFTISLDGGSVIDDSVDADALFLNSESSIDDVTDDTGTWLQNIVINQLGDNLLTIETTYENTDLMTNVEVVKQIHVYYNPLYLEQREYIDYAGKNQYQYKLIIRDINTGELYSNSLDGQKVSIFLDGNQISSNVNISNGQAVYTFDEIEVGEHQIKWSLNGNQAINNIKIYSNFIFPSKNKFFLSDTPDIYYAPLYAHTYGTNDWEPIIRKKAIASVFYYDEGESSESGYTLAPIDDETIYTDANGILHIFKQKSDYIVPRKYFVQLHADSDDLTELAEFEYEIAKPFSIVLDEDRTNIKEQAVFNIKIYDKEHYTMGQHSNYITFNKNFTGLYTFDENEYDEYYDVTIIIPMREETVGKNTITVTVNNYTESQDFKLIDKIFKLLTTTTKVGDNQIQIQCYDDDIEEIDIESEFINVNDYTKTDGVFTVNAAFIKAGEIDFKINSSDDSENFTITVQKGVLNPKIIIERHTPYTEEVLDEETQQIVVLDKVYIEEVTECYYSERESIYVRLELDDLYGDINGVKYQVATQPSPSLFRPVHTDSYTISDESYKHIPDLKPQEYEILFVYNSDSDSNYASFFIHKTFTILKNPSILEVDEQHTAFNDFNFFIYQPEFTEDNTEALIRGNCSTAVSSQSNGVWNSVGYYLEEGWKNTGLWECDFDISGNIRYVGFDILCSVSPLNEITVLMTGWEGPVATNPIGTYTRDNDNTLSFLPKRLAWQDSDTTTNNPYFTECHINMKKTSPTTLTITKTNGQYNNGSVTYEWQNLSNYPKLTIGTHVNPYQCLKEGTVQIKNFIVRGVY